MGTVRVEVGFKSDCRGAKVLTFLGPEPFSSVAEVVGILFGVVGLLDGALGEWVDDFSIEGVGQSDEGGGGNECDEEHSCYEFKHLECL